MALPISTDDIRTSFPEFATADEGLLQSCIDDADLEINGDAWGSRAELAEKYLAAHYATVRLRKSGAAGPIIGQRVGDVAVQYAQPMNSLIGSGLDPALATTSYGLNYARLVRIAGMGFATTGC